MSKEKRSHCRLVTLALLTDGEEFPKKCEVFSGNISEPGTLEKILAGMFETDKLNGLVADFGGERFLETGLKIENSARKGVFDPNMADLNSLYNELETLKQALLETDWTSLGK